MKQRLLIPIALLASGTLIGCTTGSSPQAGSGSPVGGNNVALVLGTSGSPFYEAMACGAKDEANKLGLNLDVSAAAQFSGDAQVPIVNAVTASRPSVAAVVPTDEQALGAPLGNLVTNGTRLITVDQTLSRDDIVDSAITTDNVAGGGLAAGEVNTLIGGKGKVLVITQPPGSSGQDQRVEGFEKEIASHQGIEYLGPQYASNDPQKVAQIITATLAAHPDLKAVFATNDQGAIGVITGLRQAGKTGDVKVVAYDAATAEVDALKNGAIQVLIAQDPTTEGRVAMQTAKKIIDGQDVDQEIQTDLITIRTGDVDKADQYEYKANC
ncbi:ABC transporter substrate-binding protein [Mycobacterium sp. 21AC1]|uniref:ABC transporter substrate-binding protein n=1 Tax=[Mycobacterium] appelbergii TaxID=2939269 RepID=UPI002938EE86|nr:ABC transporter substrate-binding protein [Mycobacterium sp. 21AC1]MDV3125773.1 ABC transporter substrate-binding protein [Mycobacterium sp. 21AC1]